MKSVLERTGLSLWAGLLANLIMATIPADSLVGVAPGTPIHAGMEALGLTLYGILIALVGLPLAIYDLVKHRWWGCAGLVISLTPESLCFTLLDRLMRAKGIYSD